MNVTDVMTRSIIGTTSAATVEEAESIAAEESVRRLLVWDGEELAGVVCACDLQGVDRGARIVVCMTAPVLTIDADASLEQAAAAMRESGVGCLPVVEADGVVLGIVTREDLRRSGFRNTELEGAWRHEEEMGTGD